MVISSTRMSSDWDLTPAEWSMMSRANKCAKQLYPYSSQSSEAWAIRAFRKWRTEGVTPEVLRDKQSPGITQLIAKRPPRYL